jgi:hypothetical protein
MITDLPITDPTVVLLTEASPAKSNCDTRGRSICLGNLSGEDLYLPKPVYKTERGSQGWSLTLES